jgi:hypothetical protein
VIDIFDRELVIFICISHEVKRALTFVNTVSDSTCLLPHGWFSAGFDWRTVIACHTVTLYLFPYFRYVLLQWRLRPLVWLNDY